jgi:hypothetical protein
LFNKSLDFLKSRGQIDLNPWWIAGIVAGEGSFIISHSDLNFTVKFSITLTTTNQHLIWAIWEYFCRIGGVNSSSSSMARLQIGGIKDLNNVIIPFFDQYSVLGNTNIFIYFMLILKKLLL